MTLDAARVDQDIEPPYSTLERAALAMMKIDSPEEFLPDGSLTESGQVAWHRRGYAYVKSACAVLRAIRAPSDDMVSEGRCEMSFDGAHMHISNEDAVKNWQAMIDAALGEGQT